MSYSRSSDSKYREKSEKIIAGKLVSSINFASAVSECIEQFFNAWQKNRANKYFAMHTINTPVNEFISTMKEMLNINGVMSFAKVRQALEQNDVYVLMDTEMPKMLKGVTICSEKKTNAVILLNKGMPQSTKLSTMIMGTVYILLGMDAIHRIEEEVTPVVQYCNNIIKSFYNSVETKTVVEKSFANREDEIIYRYGKALLNIFANAVNDELILFRDALRILKLDRTTFDRTVEKIDRENKITINSVNLH